MIEEQEFAVALGRDRDLMDRLIVVEGVGERDRVSGEAFTHAALTIGLECACSADGWCDLTAEVIGQGVFELRAMQRALRLLENMEIMEAEPFRHGGSPRKLRRIRWGKYLEFVDSIMSREDCLKRRSGRMSREQRIRSGRIRGRSLPEYQVQAAEPVAMPCRCEGVDYISC